jgi:hypothetical protein
MMCTQSVPACFVKERNIDDTPKYSIACLAPAFDHASGGVFSRPEDMQSCRSVQDPEVMALLLQLPDGMAMTRIASK